MPKNHEFINTKEVFVMTEKEKKDIVSIFISEYIKAKEKKDERKDKGNN